METLSQSEQGERTLQSPHNTSNLSNGTLTGYSSIETLLLNIQGLLKVAGENARHQERQIGRKIYAVLIISTFETQSLQPHILAKE